MKEVVCVCFIDRCLSFCLFSFGHCVVCLLLFTDSDYPFGIFKLLSWTYISVLSGYLHGVHTHEINVAPRTVTMSRILAYRTSQISMIGIMYIFTTDNILKASNITDQLNQPWNAILMFRYLNIKLQTCIPLNNSLTLKYPNQESIQPRFVDKGSVLLMYMQALVAVIQLPVYLYIDPLKYILS